MGSPSAHFGTLWALAMSHERPSRAHDAHKLWAAQLPRIEALAMVRSARRESTAGMVKPFRTTFTERDYARVRQLGDEYRSRVPRSVLR